MRMQAIGWDIHRKFSKVSVQQLGDEGELKVVQRKRLDHTDPVAMRDWLAQQPSGSVVAMEGSFGWPWVADLVQEMGLKPLLVHPPAMRVLVKHKAKTDRCDSDHLAEFTLLGILPTSYLAPPEVRQFRERIRYRMQLSRMRTSIKNRGQALLHRRGILHAFSDLYGKAGRAFLKTLPLPEASRYVLDSWMRCLEHVEADLKEVENWMSEQLEVDEDIRLLASVPGIGKILSHVLKSEIGEIGRFPTYRKLTSYAGLAPISNDTADRHGRRHTSKASNRLLRWAFVEAAGVVVQPGRSLIPRLSRLHQRLCNDGRCSKSEAKMAVARELCRIVYMVWSKRTPYTLAPPARPGVKKS